MSITDRIVAARIAAREMPLGVDRAMALALLVQARSTPRAEIAERLLSEATALINPRTKS